MLSAKSISVRVLGPTAAAPHPATCTTTLPVNGDTALDAGALTESRCRRRSVSARRAYTHLDHVASLRSSSRTSTAGPPPGAGAGTRASRPSHATCSTYATWPDFAAPSRAARTVVLTPVPVGKPFEREGSSFPSTMVPAYGAPVPPRHPLFRRHDASERLWQEAALPDLEGGCLPGGFPSDGQSAVAASCHLTPRFSGPRRPTRWPLPVPHEAAVALAGIQGSRGTERTAVEASESRRGRVLGPGLLRAA